MGDYNLNGLNEREFEHLSQALAIKVIAPGVMPYGDGPDGAREATFTGKMSYPSEADPWDGYLVLQCKFHKRPSGHSTRDGAWALEQLEADLKKYEDSERALKKPEYYIYVTNVVLTPVQDTGSKDKAYVLLEAQQQAGKIKGFDIWDYDKICRFLDGQEEITNKYKGFITTGDVLAKMMEVLQGQQTDFVDIMSIFLQKEMRADQFVRLEQAGQSADHKTSLAQVFVDLPAFHHPIPDPPDEPTEGELREGLLMELLEAGSGVLKSSALEKLESLSSNTDVKRPPKPGRFVVVGGPGQGKSTLSQCLCQVYRAAILKDRPQHSLSSEAATTLKVFLEQCQANDLNLSTARRFPIRIVLDKFAAALAKGEVRSLLSYILDRINTQTDRHCSPEDLRRWLAAYPWLVVLDGLDEVPASSNRQQVLENVVDFWSEAAALDADLMVVATTRPQGYSEDFAPSLYTHRHLAPLSTTRALLYGRRLVGVRYSGDPERQQKVLQRLGMACKQETTARLMRSPLQVTIMATLVDRIGQPPQERWRLFQQYYEVIYQRETERDIPTSRILQQRKADVDAIHSRVGLLLQAESERAGATEAQLSAERFGSLVRARLIEEGFEGENLDHRVHEITEAAINRLVFLVGLEADRVGFEIRSLQEFMAAEALMEGTDAQVRERLEEIAPIEHWRNVFLFAAGKCFAARQTWRDMIINLCAQLNDPQENLLAATMRAGSQLALDVYNDGVEGEQLKFRRQLADLALDLLDLPSRGIGMRLADAYEPEMDALFQQHLRTRFGQKHFVHIFTAWAVLKRFLNGNLAWAESLAEEHWPADIEERSRILAINESWPPEEWTVRKYIETIPSLAPTSVYTPPVPVWQTFVMKSPIASELPSWCHGVNSVLRDQAGDVAVAIVLPPEESVLRLGITSVDGSIKDLVSLKDMPIIEKAWMPYVAAARFAEKPMAETLAQQLNWLSEAWEPSRLTKLTHLPWPLLSCIQASESRDDLAEFAKRAALGELGSHEDWLAAEQRWQLAGVNLEDWLSVSDEEWPFNANVRDVGFPFIAARLLRHDVNNALIWRVLWRLREKLPQNKVREQFNQLITDFLIEMGSHEIGNHVSEDGFLSASPDQLKQIFAELPKFDFNYNLLDCIIPQGLVSDEWIDFLDWIGGRNEGTSYIRDSSWPQVEQIAAAFCNEPARSGLLGSLGTLALSGGQVDVPDALLQSYLDATKEDVSRDLFLSALFVRVSKGGWSDEEAVELASCAAQHAELKSTEVIKFVISTMMKHGVAEEYQIRLLLALWEEMRKRNSLRLRDLVEPLNRILRTRTSNLYDRKRWQSLALPAYETDT